MREDSPDDIEYLDNSKCGWTTIGPPSAMMPLCLISPYAMLCGKQPINNSCMKISQKIEDLKRLWPFNPGTAEAQLRQLLAEPADDAALAAEALIELKNLYHPRGSILDTAHHVGVDALPPEHRVMHLADMFGYYAGIDSDHGLIEDYGNRLPEMASALEAVGAPRSAEIVHNIVGVTTSEMRSPHKKVRMKAYSEMSETNPRAISDILDRVDERTEHIWLKVLTYILRNEQAFKTK